MRRQGALHHRRVAGRSARHRRLSMFGPRLQAFGGDRRGTRRSCDQRQARCEEIRSLKVRNADLANKEAPMNLLAGIAPAGTGKAAPSTDVTWSILGHTYWLKAESGDCFAFETLDPPGTFVPPHIHPTQ